MIPITQLFIFPLSLSLSHLISNIMQIQNPKIPPLRICITGVIIVTDGHYLYDLNHLFFFFPSKPEHSFVLFIFTSLSQWFLQCGPQTSSSSNHPRICQICKSLQPHSICPQKHIGELAICFKGPPGICSSLRTTALCTVSFNSISLFFLSNVLWTLALCKESILIWELFKTVDFAHIPKFWVAYRTYTVPILPQSEYQTKFINTLSLHTKAVNT